MLLRKLIPLLAVATLIITALFTPGCARRESLPANLIPGEASLAATVQISNILNDPDLIAAYDRAEKDPDMPGTFEELMEQIEEESGIDPRQFSEATLFGDSAAPEEYFAVILEGSFNEVGLIGSMEEALGDMTRTTYRGHTLFEGRYEGKDIAVCLLALDVVAGGTVEAVRDIIDVIKGDAAMSGQAYDAYTAPGEVWIRMAMEVPPQAVEMPGDVPIEDEMLADLQVIGMSLNKNGESVCIESRLGFASSSAAADAAEALNAIISLIGIFTPPEAEAIADVLDNICVSQSGSWVTVSLPTTVDDLEELVEAIQEMAEED